MLMADWDNDGDLDVIVANDGSSYLSINDGSGRFTNTAINIGTPDAMVVGDVREAGPAPFVCLLYADANGVAH